MQGTEGKVIIHGVTTDPEVKILHEKIGRPKKGDEWSYEQIGEWIGEKYGQNRFRTITDRWRKQVLDQYRLFIAAVPGEGFRCLDDSESANTGHSFLIQARRKAEKSSDVYSTVDQSQLTEDERRKMHVGQLFAAKVSVALGREFRAAQRRLLTDGGDEPLLQYSQRKSNEDVV